MKRVRNIFIGVGVLVVCFLVVYSASWSQEKTGQGSAAEGVVAEVSPAITEPQEAKPEEQAVMPEATLTSAQNVTLDFKDADILSVLKIISYKSGVNIITTPEVMGNVTIRLVDVPWDKALSAILKTYGFGYEHIGNIITVAPIEKLTALKKQEVELSQVQPVITEVFYLKYIDAQDAKKALDSQISARGKITVLEMSGQTGWEFGGADLGKRKRAAESKLPGRSKILIVSDIPPVMDEIKRVVEQIDIRPRQVLIETRIMEVNVNKLKDIGFDWGTTSAGAVTDTITTIDVRKDANTGRATTRMGGNALGSQVTPAVFNPMSADIAGAYPYNAGLSFLFQKLNGTKFETLMHALEENVHANILSAPRIMALNNQEASILIGTRYPILKQDTTTSGSTPVTTITLDYYQDIGIQLNVVPQIGANDSINMVIHPAVTSYTNTIGDVTQYPVLDIREAETRIVMKDGETVVIGGLLKDVKSKGETGIPFLSKIPILGQLFKRETHDTEKLDLLIFITARIVKEGELTPEEITKLEDRLGQGTPKKQAAVKSKKK